MSRDFIIKFILIICLFLGLTSISFSQVFIYNGSYSIGVNTGIAVYQYTKVNGQEIKNGTFSFIDKVDNFSVTGNYSNGEKVGDWTEVKKSYTYNDWPILKSDLIMSKVVKNNPYKETTETIKFKYSSDKTHTEIQTKSVLLFWGYPSAGSSNWAATVKRQYDINNRLVAVDGSYTDKATKKSSFKGSLKDGYGIGNWEIMDRPGHTDIFKFENYRIISRTRVDNLSKKTIETVLVENANMNLIAGNDYKEKFKINVNQNEGTLYVNQISAGVYTYKVIEDIKSKANFETIDMDFMSRLFDSMLPTGFPKELRLKETSGFPSSDIQFNNFCDKMKFYTVYSRNYFEKLSETERLLDNIQQQTNFFVKPNQSLFPRKMVSILYDSEDIDYNSVTKTLSLLAMFRHKKMYLELNAENPGKYDPMVQLFEEYNDSLIKIINKRYFQNYRYSSFEVNKGELWKDVLYKNSESLKNCDTTKYSDQFEYLKIIYTAIENSILKYNDGKFNESLNLPLIKIDDLEFLANDLNVYAKEFNSMLLYKYVHQNVKVDNLASLILDDKNIQVLYCPNTLKTDPCPKGYRIPTIEELRKVQTTLDFNFDLIKAGGPLNFNSDFKSGLSNVSFLSSTGMNFLVYNDFTDPKLKNYKFLYFPLDSYDRKKPNAYIGTDVQPTYVKCRCIKER